MQADPFQANRELEKELCAYTGAPYAIVVNSCTMAILLACAYAHNRMMPIIPLFEIPKLTYVGVPMAIASARCGVVFRDEEWEGEYLLKDATTGSETPHVGWIYDSARRFTKGMFKQRVTVFKEGDEPGYGLLRGDSWGHRVTPYPGGPRFHCVSFHITKILGHSQGGAILHNSPEADPILRRMRFDGRTEGVPPTEDTFDMIGWHAYMSPDVAAALRWKLASLPAHNADLPRDNYADLSLAPIFSGKTPA